MIVEGLSPHMIKNALIREVTGRKFREESSVDIKSYQDQRFHTYHLTSKRNKGGTYTWNFTEQNLFRNPI